jgi:hypothetical protein
MMKSGNKTEPEYAWALSRAEVIPNNLEKEVGALRKRINMVKLRPRDPETYESWMVQLIKVAYHLKWMHKCDREAPPEKYRIKCLRGALRELRPLGLIDELELEGYFDKGNILEEFRKVCEMEVNRLKSPFEIVVLYHVADIFPLLFKDRVSTSRHSKFMELAGEINCFVMDDYMILNPEESMAYYAKKHGFEIGKYLEMHRRLSQ